MDDGAKMVIGIFAVLGLAYLVGSYFFPDAMMGANLKPIRLDWDAF